MAGPLLPDRMDDFVTATLDKFYRKKWVDISTQFQNHIFARQLARMKKTPVDGGAQLNWKVQVRNNGTFKDSEMYGVDTTGVTDLLVTATAPWTKQTVNFTYDVDEETLQSGPETIINLVVARNHAMLNDYFEGMEIRMWTAPTGSDKTPRRPYGIPFWLQKSSTKEFGFNGGDPSGFSDGAGGIKVADHSRWKNGTFRYSNITADDAVAKLAEGVSKCNFLAPHEFPELGKGVEIGFYTTYPFLETYQAMTFSANDSIGKDLGKFRVQPVFMGHPMIWVPALTNSDSEAYDSTDPIYGVNWKTVSWCYAKGRESYRHKPIVAPGQHTVRQIHQDSWGQFKCLNRRANFVGARVAA